MAEAWSMTRGGCKRTSDSAGTTVSVIEAGIPDPGRDMVFSETRIGVWSIRAGTLAILLVSWEFYGRSANPALFVPFTGVVSAFVDMALVSNELWLATLDSARAMFIGFAVAIPIGTALGLLIGRYKIVEYVLDPYVSFLYALPMVVLIPLLIIWIGIGTPARIIIVFLECVFPIIINTTIGSQQVPRSLLDTASSFGASERQTIRTVVVPSMLPYIFTGVHVAIGTALVGMLLAEMLVVLRGLGGLIVTASNSYQPARVIVTLFVLVAESLLLVGLMGRLRNRLMPWSQQHGRVGG
ncbi:MAG: ABC transporter permease subunit [Acidimicrobiia bacterium]|nr:ABC transporter permease subunit [Acidimicrobiia bacterium]